LISTEDEAVAHYPSGTHKVDGLILKQEQANAPVGTSLDRRIEALTSQNIALEKRLQDRFQEIAALTRIIRERDARIKQADRQLEWFRRVLSAFTKGFSPLRKSGIKAWLPYFYIRKKIRFSLKREKLFDPDIYIALYPDVSGKHIDPFRHYILHGIQEGRKISKDIDHA
jgi:hypothetical protein